MSRSRNRWVYAAVLLVAAALGVLPALATDEVVDREIKDRRITESSGLATSAVHDGVLYTHNDSDDGPYVYAVDQDGSTAAVLTLRGAEARDWEAISPGRRGSRTIWVGDIGDNLSIWETVRVYRFKEPADLRTQDVEWTQYDLAFEDGPRDAESLLVHPETGRLYVVSKRASKAALYVAPSRLSTTSTNVLTRVADAPGLATDAAWSPSGRHYVVRGYVGATVFDGVELGRRVRKVDLPAQRQGESVAWSRDGGSLLVGSEGAFSRVYRVALDVEGESDAGPDGAKSAEPATSTGEPGDEPVVAPDGAVPDQGGSTDDGRGGLVLLGIGALALVGAGVALRAWSR